MSDGADNGGAQNSRGPGFIMFNRSPEVDELMKDPLAFVLLAQIARRARWRTAFSSDGLEIGEAMIGDHESLNMTRAEYKTRVKRLKKWQQITTRGTNRGTIAKLVSSLVFDINAKEIDQQNRHQKGQQRANREPTDNHPIANRKPLTKKETREQGKERNSEKPLLTSGETYALNSQLDATKAQQKKLKDDSSNYRLENGERIYKLKVRQQLAELRARRTHIEGRLAGTA